MSPESTQGKESGNSYISRFGVSVLYRFHGFKVTNSSRYRQDKNWSSRLWSVTSFSVTLHLLPAARLLVKHLRISIKYPSTWHKLTSLKGKLPNLIWSHKCSTNTVSVAGCTLYETNGMLLYIYGCLDIRPLTWIFMQKFNSEKTKHWKLYI